MKTQLLALTLLGVITPLLAAKQPAPREEWLTIIVHGTVGFQANVSVETILRVKNDRIEGSSYEKNVAAIREHPYLFALQPIQKLGLQSIKKSTLNVAYSFTHIFQQVQKTMGIREKNHFYTFGWPGLVSDRLRIVEAKKLHCSILEKVNHFKRLGKNVKIRLIGYSHGATLLLNLGDIITPGPDSYVIDETYLIGIPVTKITTAQIMNPAFKKIYNFYSKADKVQRLDVFSPGDFISHRDFKGCLPEGLTQIEIKFTAHLRRDACNCLPPNMRGMINQSPGHIELWFFGWAPSGYRKNLHMYPLPIAVFIPFLIAASQKVRSKNIRIDMRPEQGKVVITSKVCAESCSVPFLPCDIYQSFIKQGMSFHPDKPELKPRFTQLRSSIDVTAYK